MKVVRLASLLSLLLLTFTAIASAQYGNQRYGSTVVTCSSDDMRLHTCAIGPNQDVRLVRQRSDARCVRGQTWGTRGNQIWVDRGCRADFEVVARGGGRHGGYGPGPAPGYGGGTTTIYCASDNMRRNFCNAGPNRGIRLVRQRSDARCDMGRTYGFNRDQIWVDRGCRADFEVRR